MPPFAVLGSLNRPRRRRRGEARAELVAAEDALLRLKQEVEKL